MKKYTSLILILSFFSISVINAQVGVFTDSMNATLSVDAENKVTPSNTTGVIIPRVDYLNTTDHKEDGLIVFLDNPNPPLPTGESNGFYYWDGKANVWTPFQARYISATIDKSQFLCTGTGFKSPSGLFNDANNPVTVNLNTIKTNNPDICTLENGGITVHQAGWYYFQLSITLTKNANPENLRDIICVGLNVNNAWPTSYSEKGCNSYANGNGLTNTFTLYTPLKLAIGDFVTMTCIIDFIDGCIGSFQSDCPSSSAADKRKSAQYTITSNTIASMSVKYLGNF